MSKPYPPIEVIHATPAGGLLHVSEYLARAIGAASTVPTHLVAAEPAPASPMLPANAGIAKCRGTGLACCSVCVRALTQVAEQQQWCEPDIVDGACTLYASLECYGALLGGNEGVRRKANRSSAWPHE